MLKIRTRAVILALILLLTFGAAAQAQNGYPLPEELYVNDFAGLLTEETANAIRTHLQDLQAERGIEMTVVTIGSIHDYNTGDYSIESFATNLFNTWGIGNPQLNNGVLILVAVADRQMRIEVGSGYGSRMNDDMQGVINEFMLPAFRQGDYNGGIYLGTRAVIYQITEEWPADLLPEVTNDTQEIINRANSTSSGANSGAGDAAVPLAVGGAAAAGGGFFALQRFMRRRPRKCPSCGYPMVRLDEAADDAYLTEGQKREEQLQSVDYDVWECTNCLTRTQFHYRNWLSGYGNCPSCHHRTLQTRSTVLIPATYTSTGTRQTTKTCHHCTYRDQFTSVIPMKERSSSSSSSRSSSRSRSSFSGGKSSGGGASGKW